MNKEPIFIFLFQASSAPDVNAVSAFYKRDPMKWKVGGKGEEKERCKRE